MVTTKMISIKRSLSTFGFLLVFLSLSTGLVSAQQSTPSDDQVNAIAHQLYCPICENVPLDICPTQACHDWRELIRQMLAQGKSEDTIKQYFVDHYGARVLSEPPAAGLNWLVYIVPPVAFLAGILLLVLAFRSWRRASPASAADGSGSETSLESGQPPKTPPLPGGEDEYAARLEEQLRRQR